MHLQGTTQFREVGYARNLLARTQSMEVLHLNWLPGQHTPVHGHGETEGILYVLEGQMTVHTQYPEGHVLSQTFGPGEVYFSPYGIIHQVVNEGPGTLRTLHFYAPPLPLPPHQAPENYYHNWNEVVPYRNTQGDENLIHELLAMDMAPVESPVTRARMASFIDEAAQMAYSSNKELMYQI